MVASNCLLCFAHRYRLADLSYLFFFSMWFQDAINNTVTFADSETGRESVAEKTLKVCLPGAWHETVSVSGGDAVVRLPKHHRLPVLFQTTAYSGKS